MHPKDQHQRISKLASQVMNLYHGDFMGKGEHHVSFMTMRQKLQQRFLTHMEALGQYWLQQGDHDRAVACFERALEADPVAEEFYQHLMKAYRQAGRNSDAAQVYQRCRQNLATILGISPAKNTVEIYKSLQN